MKKLDFKISQDWNICENLLRDRMTYRNKLLDAKRIAKKEKDKVLLTEIAQKIADTEKEIKDFSERKDSLQKEFDTLNNKLGLIRLKNMVLSEALYDNLTDYSGFINKHCVNDDKTLVDSLRIGLNAMSKLTFEVGNDKNDKYRQVYNAIADRFIEKIEIILTDVFGQVIYEINKQQNEKTNH